MAQIYVGDQVKPKSINVYQGQTWYKRQVAYVFHKGIWSPIITYMKKIYTNGVEDELIAHSFSDGNLEKTSTSLLLTMDGGRYINRTYLHTANKIDVTNYSKVKFELSCSLTRQMSADFRVYVANTATGSPIEYFMHSFYPSTVFPNQVVTLDISLVSGEVFIGARLTTTDGQNGTMNLTVKRIWLE